MKYSTVEDIVRFPHPILPTVQGELDYQTIHAIWKLLQASDKAIDTHLGGGASGHLGLILSDASYAMVAPATEAGPTLWVNPTSPGRAPENMDGTAAQIGASRHSWEEAVLTYRVYTSVQQALKKQIITVFEPMFLDMLVCDCLTPCVCALHYSVVWCCWCVAHFGYGCITCIALACSGIGGGGVVLVRHCACAPLYNHVDRGPYSVWVC
jgi:hypothetical protein